MRRKRDIYGVVAILLACLCLLGVGLVGCGGGGRAIGAAATVEGRVVDVATLSVRARAVGIPGAQVTLTPTLGGSSHSDSSDISGEYRILSVPGGTYDVFVTPPSGYAPPSDPDADPTNGIATVVVPSSGTLTLPDIALAVDPDAPPPP